MPDKSDTRKLYEEYKVELESKLREIETQLENQEPVDGFLFLGKVKSPDESIAQLAAIQFCLSEHDLAHMMVSIMLTKFNDEQIEFLIGQIRQGRDQVSEQDLSPQNYLGGSHYEH